MADLGYSNESKQPAGKAARDFREDVRADADAHPRPEILSSDLASGNTVANLFATVCALLRRPSIDRSPSYAELTLLHALDQPGCPICAVEARDEERYFFYFLNESSAEPTVIEQFIRSFGFCREHNSMLQHKYNGALHVAYLYQLLAGHLREELSPGKHRHVFIDGLAHKGGRPTPCLICRSEHERADRSAGFFAHVLEDKEGQIRYGQPGLLCFQHLTLVAGNLSLERFEWLVHTHRVALQRAAEGLVQSGILEAAFHLTIGCRPNVSKILLIRRDADEAHSSDPVSRLIEFLGQDRDCPVCSEERRTLSEWNLWLDAAASDGENIEDLLPLCPNHVWSSIDGVGAALKRAVAHRVLEVAQSNVERVLEMTVPSPRPTLREWLWFPIRRLGSFRSPPTLARAMLAGHAWCPVCRRLETARDRTLQLLFALLEEGRYRSIFERGYGLCVEHFMHVPALGPPDAALEAIVEVERAKLAQLYWELAEYSRKISWSSRPESKGKEQTAPIRALLRFSGTSWHDLPDHERRAKSEKIRAHRC